MGTQILTAIFFGSLAVTSCIVGLCITPAFSTDDTASESAARLLDDEEEQLPKYHPGGYAADTESADNGEADFFRDVLPSDGRGVRRVGSMTRIWGDRERAEREEEERRKRELEREERQVREQRRRMKAKGRHRDAMGTAECRMAVGRSPSERDAVVDQENSSPDSQMELEIGSSAYTHSHSQSSSHSHSQSHAHSQSRSHPYSTSQPQPYTSIPVDTDLPPTPTTRINPSLPLQSPHTQHMRRHIPLQPWVEHHRAIQMPPPSYEEVIAQVQAARRAEVDDGASGEASSSGVR